MSNIEEQNLILQPKLPAIKESEVESEIQNNLIMEIENEDNLAEAVNKDDYEDNKETKSFTVELLIHTKVMDNREEIKNCICHNYIFQKEEEEELNESENLYVEKEIIPSIEIPIVHLKKNLKEKNELNNIESPNKFYIKMNDLTKELKKLGFPMSGSMINVYINYTKNYVYFGTEPLDNKIILYSYMLEPNKDVIKLKIINYIQKRMLDGYTNSIINTYFRKPIQINKNRNKKNGKEDKSSLDLKIYMPSITNFEYFDKGEKEDKDDDTISLSDEFSEKKEEVEEDQKDKINYGQLSDSKKRERKIGYIIEKVYAWRKLYNGYRDDNNKFIKYSLKEAAKKINVSKKSLDDYLLQIRLGRKSGFNFDDNKNKKIGTLREHVEKCKKDINNNLKEKRPRKKKTKKIKPEEEKNTKEKEKKNNISFDIDIIKSKSKSSSLKLKNSKSKSKSFKKK